MKGFTKGKGKGKKFIPTLTKPHSALTKKDMEKLPKEVKIKNGVKTTKWKAKSPEGNIITFIKNDRAKQSLSSTRLDDAQINVLDEKQKLAKEKYDDYEGTSESVTNRLHNDWINKRQKYRDAYEKSMANDSRSKQSLDDSLQKATELEFPVIKWSGGEEYAVLHNQNVDEGDDIVNTKSIMDTPVDEVKKLMMNGTIKVLKTFDNKEDALDYQEHRSVEYYGDPDITMNPKQLKAFHKECDKFGCKDNRNKFTIDDFRKNEANNNHTENAVEVVEMFGTDAEIKEIHGIDERHGEHGISDKDYRRRYELSEKYAKKLLANPKHN